jgi:AcrR family transcriptional regulator
MTSPDETKRRLLEAAGREFATHGFDGATVRAIVREAGANVAAVHYHFGAKEELYTQALLEAHRCTVRMEPESADVEEAVPEAALRAQVGHLLRSVLDEQATDWHRALMLRELIRPTSASEALVREIIRPRFERLSATLRRIRPDLHGRALHAMVFSVVGQCLFYKICRDMVPHLTGGGGFGPADAAFLTDHITAVVLAALHDGVPAGEGPP